MDQRKEGVIIEAGKKQRMCIVECLPVSWNAFQMLFLVSLYAFGSIVHVALLDHWFLARETLSGWRLYWWLGSKARA